jgi:hypothetical protein
MGIKNEKFDADFESVEKVAKKFTQRKLEGWELLYTVLKGEKVHKPGCCDKNIFVAILALFANFEAFIAHKMKSWKSWKIFFKNVNLD